MQVPFSHYVRLVGPRVQHRLVLGTSLIRDPTLEDLRPVCQPAEIIDRRNAEHWAGRLYGRKFSLGFTWFFVRLGVTAGQVTALMVGVGILGGILIGFPFGASRPSIWGPLVGAFLVQLHLVLDCSDGEVARWSKTTSARGVFVDRLGHYLVDTSVFVGIGLRAMSDNGLVWMIVALAAALGALMTKVQGDLLSRARADSGMSPLTDVVSSNEVTTGPIRRVVQIVPLYRLTGAIEASLVMFVVSGIDVLVGNFTASRYFLLSLLVVGWVMVPARLIVILKSSRLDP